MPGKHRDSSHGVSSSFDSVEQAERRLLIFLCSHDGEAELCSEIVALLERYTFVTAEHQVLFDCVKPCPPSRSGLLRAQLPARLVRAGFPDVDLEPYFGGSALTGGEALTLCRELVKRET